MLSLYIACSHDYYIADTNGSVAFLEPYQNGECDYWYIDYYASVDHICMGRRTYESIRTLAKERPYADKPTSLYTHRDLEPVHESIHIHQWPLSTVTKKHNDKKIWLVGGAILTRQALDEGVLDEVILTIVPKKLFGGVHMFGWWENPFKDHRYKSEEIAYPSGVIQVIYKKNLYS